MFPGPGEPSSPKGPGAGCLAYNPSSRCHSPYSWGGDQAVDCTWAGQAGRPHPAKGARLEAGWARGAATLEHLHSLYLSLSEGPHGSPAMETPDPGTTRRR